MQTKSPQVARGQQGSAGPLLGSLAGDNRVIDLVPALMHRIDADSAVVEVSDRWLRTLGFDRDEVIGKTIDSFMSTESASYARRRLLQLARAGSCDDLPLDFVSASGETIPMSVSISAECDRVGDVASVLLVSTPRSDYTLTPHGISVAPADLEARLFAEREFNVAVDNCVSDALIRVDRDGCVLHLNTAAERLLGTTASRAHQQQVSQLIPMFDPVTDRPLDPLTHEDRPWSSNTANVDLGERELNVEFRSSRLLSRDGQPDGCLIALSDVSEARRLRDTICFQACHDNLTGLVDRHEFSRQLKHLIEQIHDDGERHILCLLDIDQFRLINDTCGHAAGDDLLVQFSELLSHGVRDEDTLARIGSDQFAMLLRGCSTFHAQRRARALLDRLSAFRFQWEAKRFQITVSIGLVPIDIRTHSAESALRAADGACVSARAGGRNRFAVFDDQDNRYCQHFGDLKWMRRVESALEENRFVLYAQPIRSLGDSNAPDNYEILMRMVTRDGELVPPGSFFPAVERFNLSSSVDRWVIRHALTAVSEAEALAPADRFWTINLSGQSLSDRLFQDYLFAELAKHRVEPGKLCFEITETAAIAEMDSAIEFMNALRERGCTLALDDFGSGLSSYAYLKNLPVDMVKIDGQFVRDIAHNDVALAMVRSINEIAQLMGKKTVAEYVEDNDILLRLRDVGVDFVQGYGIGRPQALATIIDANDD